MPNTSNVMDYIKANLDARLKRPFVSKDYSSEEKQHLLAGLKMALSFKQMRVEDIIEIHKEMNPSIRAKMRFLTRRGPIIISANKYKDGLLETLDWLEQHQAGYGPRFEMSEIGTCPKIFENIAQLRKSYGSESNIDLATKLESELKMGKESVIFSIVPIFDTLNPHADMVLEPCTDPYKDPSIDLYMEYDDYFRERGFQIYDVVGPKFFQLVNDFNTLPRPSIEQMAAFIKSMLLLHPFPEGNGRTFTLGVLNALLYNNGYGICLDLDPHDVITSTYSTLAVNIVKNLVNLETKRNFSAFFELNATQASTSNDSRIHDASIEAQCAVKK